MQCFNLKTPGALLSFYNTDDGIFTITLLCNPWRNNSPEVKFTPCRGGQGGLAIITCAYAHTPIETGAHTNTPIDTCTCRYTTPTDTKPRVQQLWEIWGERTRLGESQLLLLSWCWMMRKDREWMKPLLCWPCMACPRAGSLAVRGWRLWILHPSPLHKARLDGARSNFV